MEQGDEPSYPILEFDLARTAFIEPGEHIQPIDIAERCVVCFFQEVIARLVSEGRARMVACQRSEIGEHPVYEIEVEGQRLAVVHPGSARRWRPGCWRR